ncbi:carboxyltransferase domain-containing protein, partial [Pseudomonas syringae group genomosp. 7]|uniref:carboxyltransferase domain-containing protein n=1 Tax=Pseudomonas syringae group genomosp. 7 TaxID=251699 RepID=UPI00376F8EEC
VEIVPASGTLLGHFRPASVIFVALAGHIASRVNRGNARDAGNLIEIPVHYYGEDLGVVSRVLDFSVDVVI